MNIPAITINLADIIFVLKMASLGVGLGALVAFGLFMSEVIGKGTEREKDKTFSRIVVHIFLGWCLYGVFALTGSFLECSRIHEENFSELSTEWQSFYTTLNEMDMNSMMMRVAIGDYIRNVSPSLTPNEYDTLTGRELHKLQRTFAQGVIKGCISLQQIIDFNFAKGKE